MTALRGSNHDFASKHRLPDARTQVTVCGVVLAVNAVLVVIVMLIETKILSHLDTLHNSHPRSEKVAAFRGTFASFEDHEQSLKGT